MLHEHAAALSAASPANQSRRLIKCAKESARYPDFRFRIVGPAHRLVHSAAFRLLAMDVADETILVQERLVGRRSVGGIGPHPAPRIGLVEQALAQTTALIGSRSKSDPALKTSFVEAK